MAGVSARSSSCTRAPRTTPGRTTPTAKPSVRDDGADDLLQPGPSGRLDHARGIELGKRLIAVAARLVARVVAGADPLEDGHDLRDLVVGRARELVQLEQAGTILGTGVREGVDDRKRLLAVRDVAGCLPRGLLTAPDAQQVVVELERDAEGPPEGVIAGDDGLVVRCEQRAGLDRRSDERRGLSADHVEVRIDAHGRVRPRGRDVEVLTLAERETRLVVEAHEPKHLPVGEPELREPVQGDAREAEQRVARVDRLRDAVYGPERGPMAALAIAVLDVVVDEAEVVAELHRGGSWQAKLVVARDRGVREEPEERSDPLAARGTRAIETEVVADHLVQAVGRGIVILDEADDLGFGVGDQVGEHDVTRGGGRHRAECTRNVFSASSLLGGGTSRTVG